MSDKSGAEMSSQAISNKLRDAEVTLLTIREHAVSTTVNPLPPSGQARGYWHAMYDILTILDTHGLPEGNPVIFKELPA